MRLSINVEHLGRPEQSLEVIQPLAHNCCEWAPAPCHHCMLLTVAALVKGRGAGDKGSMHGGQVAESALADGEVRGGDRLALMRRALRLGKPPRRWKQPPWICQLPCDPPEVGLEARI